LNRGCFPVPPATVCKALVYLTGIFRSIVAIRVTQPFPTVVSLRVFRAKFVVRARFGLKCAFAHVSE